MAAPILRLSRMFFGLGVLALVLAACGGEPRRSVIAPDPELEPAQVASELWPEPEASLPLIVEQRVPIALEVGIVVFDPGIANPDDRDARDTLRGVETRLTAALLRDVMTESGQWGPVRVLPSESQFAALTVTGEIIESSGLDLVVAIRAIDASGHVWLDRMYRGRAKAEDYQVIARKDPFASLYVGIANDLRAVLLSRTSSDLRRLENLAKMRYAAELAPEAFGDYVEQQSGRFQLARLPAENDPMLGRIERIRNQEALFIDTVDEQYVDLRRELGPTYDLWRQSSFEQAEYLEDYTDRASSRGVNAPTGSFAAMQQVYSTYRSMRIQEQDLFELATGFDNETAPTVMARGEQVVQLSGSLEQQYVQWRGILKRIIALERGGQF